MAHAAAYPNMDEEGRYAYMQNLVNDINGTLPEFLQAPTPELEAEWAKNRAELGDKFGRL